MPDRDIKSVATRSTARDRVEASAPQVDHVGASGPAGDGNTGEDAPRISRRDRGGGAT